MCLCVASWSSSTRTILARPLGASWSSYSLNSYPHNKHRRFVKLAITHFLIPRRVKRGVRFFRRNVRKKIKKRRDRLRRKKVRRRMIEQGYLVDHGKDEGEDLPEWMGIPQNVMDRVFADELFDYGFKDLKIVHRGGEHRAEAPPTAHAVRPRKSGTLPPKVKQEKLLPTPAKAKDGAPAAGRDDGAAKTKKQKRIAEAKERAERKLLKQQKAELLRLQAEQVGRQQALESGQWMPQKAPGMPQMSTAQKLILVAEKERALLNRNAGVVEREKDQLPPQGDGLLHRLLSSSHQSRGNENGGSARGAKQNTPANQRDKRAAPSEEGLPDDPVVEEGPLRWTRFDPSRLLGVQSEEPVPPEGGGKKPPVISHWVKCVPNPLCFCVSEDPLEYSMLFWVSAFVVQLCLFQGLFLATWGMEGALGLGPVKRDAVDAEFFRLFFGFYPAVGGERQAGA